ncbi:TIM-barrel domain-containing protein [Arcticibacter sp. MXS-1]|uniref:glycoside hydrolase family 31 protein n=1 Tax=Arcticibacter sp. MXS-1 TaxID=3341726 RepID=UPI0035A82CA8
MITRAAFFLFVLLSVRISYGQQSVRLDNGAYLRIETYSPSTFRIRYSESGKFPLTLSEKYGIIKGKGAQAVHQERKENGQYFIETPALVLQVSLSDGAIKLRRKNETQTLVDRIALKLVPGKNRVADFLDREFSKDSLKAGGIIGDSVKRSAVRAVNYGDSVAALLSFSLKEKERFYGLGSGNREGLQRRGHIGRMWVEYQRSEAPIPFIMSNNGWGIFYNTTKFHYFDVGKQDADEMHVYEPDQRDIDFFLFGGPDMPAVLQQYTVLTGKSFVLPRWGYGLAFGSNTMENQFNVLENAAHFRQEQIPCDIYWLEPQWMAKFYDFSTSKDWNKDKFVAELPWTKSHDPLFIQRLDDMGFKLALWLCVEHDFSIEEEDKIRQRNELSLSGKEHWFEHLRKFLDQGVRGFKLDPSRTLDQHPGMTYFNGLTDREMHNLNQVLLVKNLQEVTRDHLGKRTFHHYCGGYTGVQHFSASTLGDNGGRPETLFDIFNLGMSGHSNTTCDVLEGVYPLLPGIHMGFFLPWVQINSWAYIFHPFYFSEKDKQAFRSYAQLRYQLMPYIYSGALEAHRSGMPIVRPMPLMYPREERFANTSRQFFFGESFLVGAFTDTVDLPSGKWINYWTGKAVAGGRKVKADLPAQAGGPLFVKAGAIIPFQETAQFISPAPPASLTLKIYPSGQSSFNLLEDDGESYDYEKGALSKTSFYCEEGKNAVRFRIAATEGSYKGMPQKRSYSLLFNGIGQFKQARLNNVPLNTGVSFDRKSGMVKVNITVDTKKENIIQIL